MYNQNQGGRSNKPRKEVINKVEYTGIVKPVGRDENAPIKFYPFKTGGGAVHFNLKITEPVLDVNGNQRIDENGSPVMMTTYVPVNVRVNRNITAEILSKLVPGMKVHVVGRTRFESYQNKSGEKEGRLICDAYVFDILEMPMMQYQSPYGQPMQQYGQPMQPMQGQQYVPQYGQPMQGQPYGQPMQGQQYYQQPQQQAYGQGPQYGQPMQSQPVQGQQMQPPAYYQQPQQQGQPSVGMPDMPADIAGPSVKPINI